jgi:glycerophosphoryl diester phosphodiesterase
MGNGWQETPGSLPRPRAPLSTVVAHRGNAADFPENTLPAFASALESGLSWVEMDIQLSADGVPFVIHDARLERTTRAAGDVRLMPASELAAVDAGEPRRFGDAHRATALPRLTDFAALLAGHPGAGAFVELKRASLRHHGPENCVQRMFDALGAIAARCVPISFDAAAIALARAATGTRIGWVIDGFGAAQLDLLQELQPDFVFYDHHKCPRPETRLPAGPWRWVAYEVEDAARAFTEFSRGAAMVESMAPLRVAAELSAHGGGT